MKVAAPAERPPSVAEPADWDAVARVRVGVHQQYRYDYAAPVSELRQRLVMLPPPLHGDQRLLASELAVTGADGLVLVRERDVFGNCVHRASADAVREAVEFTATFTVERRADAPPARLPRGADAAPYLAPTALTAPDDRILAAAAAIAGEVDARAPGTDAARRWALADGAAEWAAGAIAYRYGVTGVQTPAAMALHLGSGVCQDYAHLALAVLRVLGVPARYVSGHLLGEGAPHAWCEALLPDPEAPGRLRAVPHDPTHRTRAGLNYVTVAVGRDYADVAPTSGSFTGPVPGAFTALKDAWIVELEEGDA